MDEKLIGKYKFVFLCPDGQDILADLREVAGMDVPFGEDLTDGQMRQKAAYNDFFQYIKMMTEMPEKPKPKEQ
jgi:hypothetical protein